MKKLLAVLLVAVLAATPLSVAVSAADETTYTPYVINFDDGKTVDDYIVDGSGNVGLRKAKFSFEQITGPNGTESNALKIDGTVNPGVTTVINQNESLGGTPSSIQNPYFAGYKLLTIQATVFRLGLSWMNLLPQSQPGRNSLTVTTK